ncbi:MAG: mechanosensitive ion channel [Deltaproteobacteria bacterium]|nr:mechanosensitive ion channel [Deltaproteobacteria bacterium]
MEELIEQSATWLRPLVLLGGAVVLGLAGHWLIFLVLKRLASRQDQTTGAALVKCLRAPLRAMIPLLVAYAVLPLAKLSPDLAPLARTFFSLALIGAVTWLLIGLASAAEQIVLDQFRMDVEDNLRARKVRTQVNMIKRGAVAVICVIAFGSMLMVFDKVRQLGTSILASAGVLGIIVGFAAQKSIGTLLAGLQVALTQPVRIDDVVIVEGEWGRIEEMTMTYVVVKIWDQRRLIVPMTHFIENSIQSWTRTSAEILGTVFIYVDYSVPVEAVRDKLRAILEESPLWDGRAWGLQVTNATERTMELRALMSAKDASDAWSLRCHVRESLIDFVSKEFPGGLPKVRAELKSPEPDEATEQQPE